jgi:NAD(P)-dependent dehydrogenase (short-subunit alcohol dehydrogenase family)
MSTREALAGQVAVVLGVGRDLGRSTALALAREGADVVLVARTSTVTAQVADEIHALGRRAWAFGADLTDPAHCEEMAAYVRTLTDHVDVLVSVVGGAGTSKGAEFAHARDDGFEAWRAVFDTTFWAPAQAMGVLVDLLRAADEAHVVVVNSLATVQPMARRGAYNAAKAALAGLTRTMAVELAADGIRVNGLHMGPARAQAWEGAVAETVVRDGLPRDEVVARYEAMSPLNYVPDVDEIAETIVFLASRQSRPMTGQGVHVSLGAWMS